MRESVTYQEILEEGKKEGKKLGIDEGKKLGIDEGKKLGIDEGNILALRSVVLRMGEKRFGVPTTEIVERVQSIASEEKLYELIERLQMVESWSEFFEA